MVTDTLQSLLSDLRHLTLEGLNDVVIAKENEIEDIQKQLAVVKAIRDTLASSQTPKQEAKETAKRGTLSPKVMQYLRSQDFPLKACMISRALGIKNQTIHGILQYLIRRNLVEKTEEGYRSRPIILPGDNPEDELAYRPE